MKKIIGIFIIVMILGVMFAGCSDKRTAVNNDGFVDEIDVKPFTVNPIVVEENVIEENVIEEDVLEEDIIFSGVFTFAWNEDTKRYEQVGYEQVG